MCELVHIGVAASADGKRPRPHGDTCWPGQVKQSGSTLVFGPSYSASRRAEHFLLTSIVSYSWMVIFWTRPARAVTLQGPTTTARPINGIRSQSTSVSGRVVQTTVATSRAGQREWLSVRCATLNRDYRNESKKLSCARPGSPCQIFKTGKKPS
jgi:hypothetical protein